jgi:hypothetical protein
MATLTSLDIERLKKQYAGKRVTVAVERPELTRFAGLTGHVATINANGRALVELEGLGASRYDIAPEYLNVVDE